MWVCLEVKQNFALDQADFQSMVSGEPTSVAIKNKKSKTVEWSVPGILMGNEFANYTDAQGSMTRRIFVIEFNNHIPDAKVDPYLVRKIREETPALMVKFARFYIGASELFGKESIWKHAPEYFKETQMRLRNSTSVVHQFISEKELFDYGTGHYIPYATLVETIFNDYCDRKKIKTKPPDESKWNPALEDFGFTISEETLMYECKLLTCKFVIGIDVKKTMTFNAPAQQSGSSYAGASSSSSSLVSSFETMSFRTEQLESYSGSKRGRPGR
jgi:hypothetical protein